MDLNLEKERLLGFIEVGDGYTDIDVKLDNIDLIIEPIDDKKCNLTIVSDIIMDLREMKKYDKDYSEVILNYRINDTNFNTIYEDNITEYFYEIIQDYEMGLRQNLKNEI